ncbi:transglycosylase SLT domain-containing protein [Sulfurimonas sp. HSL-3221]|uniref:transglycosylase SLT domain-containing protein n=1 Tax=Sulfurimonadaceae TaxID=2771471 RepID=UPI001E462FF3|nr:transglycosylase SLT domain-containing protein [Sulfurimonas sp. HSL-3221]UFS61339.1 transglycosylase SLT domain-containing protein [Sulfurimonas sp. HSL-3221]
MRLRAALATLLLGTLLSADITLEQIRSKPPSNARNFMIWQYFDQNITSAQADEAFYLIRNVGRRMFFAYAEKSARPEVAYTVKCMKMGVNDLIKSEDAGCMKLALSVGKLSAMHQKARDRVVGLVGDASLKAAAEVLNDPDLQQHYKRYPPALFLRVFNGSYGNSRRKQFNFIPDYDYMQLLAKAPGFTSAVMSTINDDKLSKFGWALTKVDAVESLDPRGLFYLGLNQLQRGKKSRAIELFQLSGDKAYYQSDKDKALFWQALASEKNDLMWKLLAQSWDINFYSLYAMEKTGIFPENYYSQLQTSDTVSDLNLSDPFVWNDLLDTINRTPKDELYALAKRYDAKNLVPLQSFIIEKASRYRLQGYVMPYDAELNDVDTDTKAIIYALMRQESRFIPAALSHSYALGLMQMMPFLCRAMDGKVDCGRDTLFDMFDPHINLLYAKPHIAWLQYRVYHPLFIAYAYNGGIGFTKRYLLDDKFNAGPYEPFLSMELMRTTETREYGKKVLTNYVVYKKILGEPVSLIDLCETLLHPSKTDRFRKTK